jgi:hypothetical protein
MMMRKDEIMRSMIQSANSSVIIVLNLDYIFK